MKTCLFTGRFVCARQETVRARQLAAMASDAAFRTQAVDARWSLGAAMAVHSALSEAQQTLRGQVRSVECRSQSCRVEFGGVAGDLGRALPALAARLAPGFPGMSAAQIDQGDGHVATVLYLMR